MFWHHFLKSLHDTQLSRRGHNTKQSQQNWVAYLLEDIERAQNGWRYTVRFSHTPLWWCYSCNHRFSHGSLRTLGSLLSHSGIDRRSGKPTVPVSGQLPFSLPDPGNRNSSLLHTLKGVLNISPSGLQPGVSEAVQLKCPLPIPL